MAKPQRFPRKVEFWTTDAQAEAIDRLDASGLLNQADHLRRAIELYLQHLDALAMSRLKTSPPAFNSSSGQCSTLARVTSPGCAPRSVMRSKIMSIG